MTTRLKEKVHNWGRCISVVHAPLVTLCVMSVVYYLYFFQLKSFSIILAFLFDSIRALSAFTWEFLKDEFF